MPRFSYPAAVRATILSAVARMVLLVGVLFGSAACAGAQQAAQGTLAGSARPIRALYITGGGFHDFVAQEKIIPPGISARTNIRWTIDHTAGTATDALIERHQNTSWADEFDVVVYNMSFSFVVDPAWIDRLAYAHRDRGVPAVVLHGATHSYRRSESEAWRELMGAASFRHDRQRTFGIERLAPDHPIMKDLPKEWGPGVDELYDIDKVWPTMTPLAQGWSVETEEHHPVVWTNQFGKARVFVTTMGHNNATMADAGYLDLVTRGLLWAVGRLEADGAPAAAYGPPAAGN